VTPAGIIPRLKQFTVTGIFRMDYNEYDSGLALIHLADAQKLLRHWRRRLGRAAQAQGSVSIARGHARSVRAPARRPVHLGWTRSNANYFRAVQIEKTMMFIILLLIVLVAAFNSVSTLVMR